MIFSKQSYMESTMRQQPVPKLDIPAKAVATSSFFENSFRNRTIMKQASVKAHCEKTAFFLCLSEMLL